MNDVAKVDADYQEARVITTYHAILRSPIYSVIS